MQQPEHEKLLTLKEVMRLAGVRSRTSIYRWVNSGLFPRPIIVGLGQLRWLPADIESWIVGCARARDGRRGDDPSAPAAR